MRGRCAPYHVKTNAPGKRGLGPQNAGHGGTQGLANSPLLSTPDGPNRSLPVDAGLCASALGVGGENQQDLHLLGASTHLPPLRLRVPSQQLDHVTRLEGQDWLPGGSRVAMVILQSHHLGTCGGQGRGAWLWDCIPAANCAIADLGLPGRLRPPGAFGQEDRCLRPSPKFFPRVPSLCSVYLRDQQSRGVMGRLAT